MLHSEPSIEETKPHAAKISVRTQLIVFFILSFLIAWLAWLPMVLNPKLPQPFSILGLFAPAISATLPLVSPGQALLRSVRVGANPVLLAVGGQTHHVVVFLCGTV